MSDDKSNERTKIIAEALASAANEPEAPQGAAGLIGGKYLWGLAASRIITMMEEIAREAVDQYLNPPGDKPKR